MHALNISQRRACRAVSQPRSTQRYARRLADDEVSLTDRITELASKYGRYGYRRITALLKSDGWRVNHKRVERIWHREGLKVPQKQPKRGRLWLNDGSCVRLRPTHAMHVWSYDFVKDRTRDGRAIGMLNIIDKYSRECLGCIVERNITSADVICALADLFIARGVPEHIRSDNGGAQGTQNRPGFNPHRPRRVGATREGLARSRNGMWFQSSPTPKGRCNSVARAQCPKAQ